MSDSDTSGFGKFVPGFDFLQNLAKGATNNMPQMPNLGNWVAPTLNVEELDKRIEELKNVHFWLEQNSRALGATIQALEVQKMTLNTLKGMNFNLADVANALKPKATSPVQPTAPKAPEPATPAAAEVTPPKAATTSEKPTAGVGGMIDPMQLWGSLTTQFQQIAASALKEAASKSTANMAASMVKESMKPVKKPVVTAPKRTTVAKKATKAPVKTTKKPAARG
jgi:hypothetical protein